MLRYKRNKTPGHAVSYDRFESHAVLKQAGASCCIFSLWMHGFVHAGCPIYNTLQCRIWFSRSLAWCRTQSVLTVTVKVHISLLEHTVNGFSRAKQKRNVNTAETADVSVSWKTGIHSSTKCLVSKVQTPNAFSQSQLAAQLTRNIIAGSVTRSSATPFRRLYAIDTRSKRI